MKTNHDDENWNPGYHAGGATEFGRLSETLGLRCGLKKSERFWKLGANHRHFVANLVGWICGTLCDFDHKMPVCHIVAFSLPDCENAVIRQQAQPRGFFAIVKCDSKLSFDPTAFDWRPKHESVGQNRLKLCGDISGPGMTIGSVSTVTVNGGRIHVCGSPKHSEISEPNPSRRSHNASGRFFGIAVEPGGGAKILPFGCDRDAICENGFQSASVTFVSLLQDDSCSGLGGRSF